MNILVCLKQVPDTAKVKFNRETNTLDRTGVENIMNPYDRQALEVALCLKDKEECYTFFEDVCTINELLSLSQRFEVAKMLTDKRTYLDISEKTGASTATISRVNRSLNYGNDGYEMVFARMKKNNEEQGGEAE